MKQVIVPSSQRHTSTTASICIRNSLQSSGTIRLPPLEWAVPAHLEIRLNLRVGYLRISTGSPSLYANFRYFMATDRVQ
ncbi:MAG: hypothetical protein MJY68_00025 [Bacteroidaceae bacterium]|nr:hypothetical protein [Bacteroidaceae bacterium]